MTGMSGAVTTSPIAPPMISIARLAIRTLRRMAHGTMHDTSLLLSLSMAAPIRISVPGTLRYRDMAVRVVAEAARLGSSSSNRDPTTPLNHDVRDPFDTAIVSAFAEIYNNVAIHAYKRKGGGMIEIAI